MLKQRTLRSAVTVRGVGLHSGQPATITIEPHAEHQGIVFQTAKGACPALAHAVSDTTFCTTLHDGYQTRFRTIEHLMAALYGTGIDNALITLYGGEEVPILDGSAQIFVDLIRHVGVIEQTENRVYLRAKRPLVLAIGDNERMIAIVPNEKPQLDVRLTVDFKNDFVFSSGRVLRIADVETNFCNELANARTFGFAEDVNMFRAHGLAQGFNGSNALLVDGESVNAELRSPDEFIRHKMLDLIGDLYLCGYRLQGTIYAHGTGHSMNVTAAKLLQCVPHEMEIRR